MEFTKMGLWKKNAKTEILNQSYYDKVISVNLGITFYLYYISLI